MSVKNTKIYSVVINRNQVQSWLSNLFSSGVTFEILDPRELGSKWANVKFIDPKPQTELYIQNGLGTVLESYKAKSMLSSFLDQRIVVNVSEIESVRNNIDFFQDISSKIIKYSELEDLEIELARVTENLNLDSDSRSVLVGKNLDHDLKRLISKQQLEGTLPEIEIVNLPQGWDLIICDSNSLSDVHEVVKKLDKNPVLSKGEFIDLIKSTKKDIKTELESLDYNVENLSGESLKKLAVYHMILESDKQAAEAIHHIFSFDENSPVCFSFVAIPTEESSRFISFLNKENTFYEITDWDHSIVVWNNQGGLGAFQGVAQALGTIDTKEADPSWSIAFFFSLFFAFCLGDAVYGLFLVAFCSYFLYLKKLKPQFKSIFRIFFFSGLATIIFGALTNSWAGDLFINTPAKGFFEGMQLINPLDPNAPVPFNQFLKQNGGISPIVGFMAISLCIGMLNIYTAYVLKIVTSIHSKDFPTLTQDLSWVGFVTSLFGLLLALSIGSSLLPVTQVIFGLFALSLFVLNKGKGVGGKITSGLISIYNLIGLFADILSFTRLVAVGLTSSIIANVVNLLAGLIYVAIPMPGVGLIIAGLVLVGGHIFNLAVALFGAYINPLRLHYVEFMPKFFEGRGRSLKSAKPQWTHLEIANLTN